MAAAKGRWSRTTVLAAVGRARRPCAASPVSLGRESHGLGLQSPATRFGPRRRFRCQAQSGAAGFAPQIFPRNYTQVTGHRQVDFVPVAFQSPFSRGEPALARTTIAAGDERPRPSAIFRSRRWPRKQFRRFEGPRILAVRRDGSTGSPVRRGGQIRTDHREFARGVDEEHREPQRESLDRRQSAGHRDDLREKRDRNQSDRNPGLWPEHDLHLCQRRRGFDVLRV